MNVSKNHKFTTAITPAAGAAAATDLDGAILDTAGYKSLLAYIRMGAITTAAVTSAKLQHGNESNLSDAADITGATVTIADNDDNEAFILELSNIVKRYVRVVVLRATQTAVVAEAHYQLFNAETFVATQPAAVTVTVV